MRTLEKYLNTPKNDELIEENNRLNREIKKLNRQLALANDNTKKYQSVSAAKENVMAIITAEKSRQERQLQVIMDNSPDIVVLLDRSMNFLLSTKSFSSLVPNESLELPIHKSFRQVFSSFAGEACLRRMESIFKKALETNKVQAFDEKLCIGTSKSMRNYAVSVIPFAYDDVNNDGLLVNFHDMTERIEMESRIRQALRDATIASKAKSDFLANMSHEIRTPMNAIQGMTELIMHEKINDTVMAYANDIRNASRGLLSIINAVLDISKIESGKLEIVPVRYHISSLLVDVISIIKVRADTKGISFVTHIDTNIPSELIGDEVRIKQILINLLNNAVKFTNEGQITMSVSSQMNNDVCQLVFSVSDTGVGVKPEDIGKVFVLFQQIDTKRNRNVEGTGLGLSISKQLVEMMDGSIAIESEYGVGSTFTATIKQTVANSRPIAELKQPDKSSVLVYENRPAYLSSVKYALDSLCCRYMICANRADMNRHLDDFKCDYIFVSSLYINNIQGAASQKQPNAVIVVLNGDGNLYTESNILSISMPIHCLQLASILNDGHDGYSNITNPSHAADIVTPEAKVLVVDDNDVNLKVAVGLLMNTYKLQADTASSGMRAVEMVQATYYDLIFMDHMMPDMDGIDATVAIRALGKKYEKLPIVALTANAIGGMREMFIAEGLDDFLPKPIEMSKLDLILKKWLPKDKQQSREKDVVSQEICIEIPGINTQKGVRNSGGVLEDYNGILAIYAADSENRLAEMAGYHRDGNIKALSICVHALKGSSANIGADDVSGMAEELEAAGKSGDTLYIDANLQRVTDAFSNLLVNIQSYLSSVPKKDIVPNKTSDYDFLKTTLDEIERLMDNFDIDMAEHALAELYTYHWDDNVLTWITKIKDCISVFDYDGIETAISELRAVCDAELFS